MKLAISFRFAITYQVHRTDCNPSSPKLEFSVFEYRLDISRHSLDTSWLNPARSLIVCRFIEGPFKF